MKVLHINFAGGCGGAAIAAKRISKALNASGINSEVWVARDEGDAQGVRCIKSLLSQKLDSAKNILVQKGIKYLGIKAELSVNLFPSQLIQLLNASDADVIHLHWINAEMISIPQLAKIRKPVVWTLHDMWAFCGAEHYTMSTRYISGYQKSENRGQLPARRALQLGERTENKGQNTEGRRQKTEEGTADNFQLSTSNYLPKVDLDRWVFKRKRKHWANWKPYIVTPSSWLTDCARKSMLLGYLPTGVIPNCLDLELFKPMNQAACRKRFGLPVDKKLVLFGAVSPSEQRKGGDMLEEALKKLANQELELVVFGAAQGPQLAGLKTHWIGRVSVEQQMVQLYNSADVMCVPSRQEAFGQTASEPLACGVPVVAFDTTGLKDIVDHKVNGYLAHPFESDDFARGIEWVLSGGQNSEDCGSKGMCSRARGTMGEQQDTLNKSGLAENARKKAEEIFSMEVVAKQYMHVYKSIL